MPLITHCVSQSKLSIYFSITIAILLFKEIQSISNDMTYKEVESNKLFFFFKQG